MILAVRKVLAVKLKSIFTLRRKVVAGYYPKGKIIKG